MERITSANRLKVGVRKLADLVVLPLPVFLLASLPVSLLSVRFDEESEKGRGVDNLSTLRANVT